VVSICTKFEVCEFSRLTDFVGVQNYKSRSLKVGHAGFDLLLHFLFVGLTINPHTKFEVCSFSRSRDIEGVLNYKK